MSIPDTFFLPSGKDFLIYKEHIKLWSFGKVGNKNKIKNNTNLVNLLLFVETDKTTGAAGEVSRHLFSTGTLRSIRRLSNLVKVLSPWCSEERFCLLPFGYKYGKDANAIMEKKEIDEVIDTNRVRLFLFFTNKKNSTLNPLLFRPNYLLLKSEKHFSFYSVLSHPDEEKRNNQYPRGKWNKRLYVVYFWSDLADCPFTGVGAIQTGKANRKQMSTRIDHYIVGYVAAGEISFVSSCEMQSLSGG